MALGPPSLTRCVLTPAVYPDGRVCISILHAPGDDPMGYESSAERWSPVQSVEKILLSVVSMLAGNWRPLRSCLRGSVHACDESGRARPLFHSVAVVCASLGVAVLSAVMNFEDSLVPYVSCRR